jgi:hypothetical protein
MVILFSSLFGIVIGVKGFSSEEETFEDSLVLMESMVTERRTEMLLDRCVTAAEQSLEEYQTLFGLYETCANNLIELADIQERCQNSLNRATEHLRERLAAEESRVRTAFESIRFLEENCNSEND